MNGLGYEIKTAMCCIRIRGWPLTGKRKHMEGRECE